MSAKNVLLESRGAQAVFTRCTRMIFAIYCKWGRNILFLHGTLAEFIEDR